MAGTGIAGELPYIAAISSGTWASKYLDVSLDSFLFFVLSQQLHLLSLLPFSNIMLLNSRLLLIMMLAIFLEDTDLDEEIPDMYCR